MKSLNDYESKKNSLMTNLENSRKQVVAVNNFIIGMLTKNHSTKATFLPGLFTCYNPDRYGNKFNEITLQLNGDIMSNVIEANPKMKLQLLQTYRSELNSNIRKIEMMLDQHNQQAIEYLKNEKLCTE